MGKMYTIFTNDLPLVLKEAHISTQVFQQYTCSRLQFMTSSVLNRELKVEWISGNEIVLNVSKTNCIVFGTNCCSRAKQTLNLYIN